MVSTADPSWVVGMTARGVCCQSDDSAEVKTVQYPLRPIMGMMPQSIRTNATSDRQRSCCVARGLGFSRAARRDHRPPVRGLAHAT